MTPVISTSTATVFLANGRRYLTKKSAYRSAAKAKIKTRCQCEKLVRWGPESLDYTPPITCHYHEESRFEKLVQRLAQWYKHIDKER